MKVISFSLNGKMAHFRKYYSNSTALSYFIPPVTTVKGIIAGLIGFERDEYYDLFSNNKCKISIAVEEPIKKITQTMNLLKIEKPNDLNGSGKNRTQNNMEFVVPKNIRNGQISYNITFYHSNNDIMKQLESLICTGNKYYFSSGISFALGSAQCLGWISNGKCVEAKEFLSYGEPVYIYGAIDKEQIKKIELTDSGNLFLAKEETITEFDSNRLITENSKKDIIINLSDAPILVRLKIGANYYDIENKKIFFVG
jgi:CRISPR-associated protein Cas5h